MYVAPPPPPPEPSYLGYSEIPAHGPMFARQMQPIQVQKPQHVPQPAPPVNVAKPPAKRERPSVRPVEEPRVPVPARQVIDESDSPPGEFDMVTRGRLPAILFTSEVTIKT